MLIQKNYKAHANRNHPENFTRIDRIIERFPKATYAEVMSDAECIKHILRVHPKSYIDRIKRLSKESPSISSFILSDNPFYEDTYDAAIGAVSTSIETVDRLTFGAIRPPGHHAYPERFEGFCYFNNIAIAVRYAQSEKGYDKVAVIDIDAHYGNGTHWIFKNDETVFYTSVHANPTVYYPGVKHKSENSFLVDVEPSKVDDNEMLKIVDIMLEKVEKFGPSLIAVSAGFDNYCTDPLMRYNIRHIETYGKIGEAIKRLNVPTFALLEGGYSDELGTLVESFYKGLFGKTDQG